MHMFFLKKIVNKKWMTGNYYYLNMKHIPPQQKVNKHLEETFPEYRKFWQNLNNSKIFYIEMLTRFLVRSMWKARIDITHCIRESIFTLHFLSSWLKRCLEPYLCLLYLQLCLYLKPFIFLSKMWILCFAQF